MPKYNRDISEIEQKVINMYVKGLTTREVSEKIEDIYGFEASAELVSKITDKIQPQIEEWQNRVLCVDWLSGINTKTPKNLTFFWGGVISRRTKNWVQCTFSERTISG